MSRAVAVPPPAPVAVSDRTCLAVLGLRWSELSAALAANGVAPQTVGRRRVVRVDVALQVLGLGDGPGAPTAPAWSPDDVMREIRAGGSR